MHTIVKYSLIAAAGLALTACGNFSRHVAKDGCCAGELLWPSPNDVTPMHKGGTFPDATALRQVKAGLNKQQVAGLIGYPHFHEGVWRVREWNYLFNFRQPGTDDVAVCQFKVLFDDQQRAQSFYWSPQSCSTMLDTPTGPAAAVVTPTRVLPADTLFEFDSAVLSSEGQHELDGLVVKLQAQAGGPGSVRIVGYTDRLGSESYNRALSQRRAEAVKDYLVAHGLPAGDLSAIGAGEAAPLAVCADQPQQALVNCLAPNRRVEVMVRSAEGM